MQSENLPVPAAQQVYYPIEALERMAAAIAKSQLFGMKSPEQALALMLTAQAEGQHPATVTQDYDIVQGRPARKTNSVLARFQAAGGSVEWHELTDAKADATFTPPPRAGKPLRIEWTYAMAVTAELTGKDNWKKYKRAMLRARCIAEGVRATYPAAIGGMLVIEEAQDLPPVDVTSSAPLIPQPQARSAPTTIEGEAKREPDASKASDEKARGTPASEGQIKMIRSKAAAAEVSEGDILREFKLETLDGISVLTGNALLEFLKDPEAYRARVK